MNEQCVSVVTGAAGRIGFPLCIELKKRGSYVRAMCRQDNHIAEKLRAIADEVVIADVTDKDSLIAAFTGADYVYHLAAIISLNSKMTDQLMAVNVGGTENVVDACIECGVKRLVSTSSVHALHFENNTDVLCELPRYYPDKVHGPYAKTKALAANVVIDAVHERGLDAVVAMPSGVIGAYEYKLSNFGQMVKDVSRRKLPVRIKGEYDFVDTEDVCRALADLREKGIKGESYLLGGHKASVKELIETTAACAEVKPPKLCVPTWLIRVLARPMEWFYVSVLKKMPLFTPYSIKVLHDNCNFSHEKIAALTGYNPTPIAEALRKQVEFNSGAGDYSGASAE